MASRYWVGGTGNWDLSTTTHWSATSGGAGGASAPVSTDVVFFDGNSGAGTVTLTQSPVVTSVDYTGWTGSLSGSANAIFVTGNLTLGTGMSWAQGVQHQINPGTGNTAVITSNGKTFGGGLVFNGGGTVSLADALILSAGLNITHSQGTFTTNGFSIATPQFISQGSIARTLTLGSSTITTNVGSSAIQLTGTNLTITANTATFVLTSATFSTAYSNLNGASISFLNITSAATISGVTALTLGTLTVTGGVSASASLALACDITCSSLAVTSASTTNRVLVQSSTLGTTRTVTAAAVSLSNVDFTDITGAGTASPFTGTLLGDALGNSGITFPASITCYWVSGTGGWSDVTKWRTTSGGATQARVPLPHDDVRLDANSFTAASQVVTPNMARLGRNIDWTGTTNFPSWTSSGTTTVYGSVTLAGAMQTTVSVGSPITFAGRTACTLTTAGHTWGASMVFTAFGGSYTLQDALVCSGGSGITHTWGTLDANGFSLTCASLSSNNTNTRALNLNGVTVSLTATGVVLNLGGNQLTLNVSGALFDITNTASTSKTVACTFTGGVAVRYQAVNTANSTLQLGSSSASAKFSSVTVSNNGSTFRKTVAIFAGASTVANTNMSLTGTATNPIFLNSATTGSIATITKGTGTFTGQYLTIQDVTASGAATWLAIDSTDNGNNSGFVFASSASASGGSLTLSGAVVTSLPAAGSGALSLAGAALASASPSVAAALVLAGTGSAAAALVATGTLVLQGSAAAGTASTATGSLALTGTATVFVRLTPTGALLLTGTATAGAGTAVAGALVLSAVGVAAAALSAPPGALTLAASASAAAPLGTTGELALLGSASAQAPLSPVGTLLLLAAATGRAQIAPSGQLVLDATASLAARVAAQALLSLQGSTAVQASLAATGALALSAVVEAVARLAAALGTLEFGAAGVAEAARLVIALEYGLPFTTWSVAALAERFAATMGPSTWDISPAQDRNPR